MSTSLKTLADLYDMRPVVDWEAVVPRQWTWRDPRKHPIAALEGPLASTIEVADAEELRDACGFVMLHTFLEAAPINRPEAEWERDGLWITTHPSEDARTLEVRSRLHGRFDTERYRLAGRIASVYWDDNRFAIDEDELGTYAGATVSASPFVLARLASVLLDLVEATVEFRKNLDAADLHPTFAAVHVDFEYFWCGTGLVSQTGKYDDISENPINIEGHPYE